MARTSLYETSATPKSNRNGLSFLARDSMIIICRAPYAIARPSVRPSDTRVDQSTRCRTIAGRTARCRYNFRCVSNSITASCDFCATARPSCYSLSARVLLPLIDSQGVRSGAANVKCELRQSRATPQRPQCTPTLLSKQHVELLHTDRLTRIQEFRFIQGHEIEDH